MYFILSKVLSVFIMPLFWAFVMFVYVACSRKRQQKMLITGIVIFYFFSIRLTADAFGRIWDINADKVTGRHYSAVMLLGGFVSEDEKGNGYFNDASVRYNTALKLLKDSVVQRILFTGGNGTLHETRFTEAGFVKNALHQAGVADSLIILEDKARNTEENVKFAKKLLEQAKLKPPYLLVTSAYHMRRALLLCSKQNLNVDPYPCHYLEAKFFDTGAIVPNTEAMAEWNTYIKEMIGYVVALMR